MVAVLADEFPVHAAIFGYVNATGAAGDEFFLVQEYHAATISMRRFLWYEPGAAMVEAVCTIARHHGISGEIAANHEDPLIATGIAVGRKGIGAGTLFSLYQWELRHLFRAEETRMHAPGNKPVVERYHLEITVTGGEKCLSGKISP